ncbi:MAG: hypothetical protein QNJ67_21680 [Kiloniellales bacterium]|nr:hypothetical protein [Kiloniellales bacterium]
MHKTMIASAIGLVGVCGVALAALSTNQGPDRGADGHGHGAGARSMAMQAGDGGHDHGKLLSLPPGPEAPTLEIEIIPDRMSGWNLRIETTNFRFSPGNASGPHRAGEGHAHAYVNGRKVARVYGPWFHLGALPKGEVAVTVTLNSNDHRALAVADAPLEATRILTVE